MSSVAPAYVISASVPPGNRVKRFHSDRSDGARSLLIDAEQLRYAGFDLRMNASPNMTADGAWAVKRGNRKGLRLYQDGTLILRAAADDSFLGWGVNPDTFESTPRLNPVAVVEIHAGFVMLYSRILPQLERAASEVLFQLVLRNVRVGSERLFMTKHVERRIDTFDLDRYVAEVDPGVSKLAVS